MPWFTSISTKLDLDGSCHSADMSICSTFSVPWVIFWANHISMPNFVGFHMIWVSVVLGGGGGHGNLFLLLDYYQLQQCLQLLKRLLLLDKFNLLVILNNFEANLKQSWAFMFYAWHKNDIFDRFRKLKGWGLGKQELLKESLRQVSKCLYFGLGKNRVGP